MNTIINAIIERLAQELATATKASEQAHASATHKENVAENKYDTLAVEAAYLAHGQSVRIAELQGSIAQYRRLDSATTTSHTTVQVGSTVTINDNKDHSQILFIGPSAGGMKLAINGLSILTVSPQTPMGRVLIGTAVDDEISIVLGNERKHFSVIEIF
ncbi:MAG: transcription elongation GreA/GreB family factor [Pseudomonadales bacterium]